MKAADIEAALIRYYHPPEYGIVFQVAQATGFSAHRHLDALAMDLWPSRGLGLHGIEIKVNIYDWRKEKSNPEKAEEIARFCDFFWIAAPKDLIPVSELPLAWGLLEVNDEGQVYIRKNAEKTSAQEVTKQFLAAVFRAAGRSINPETLSGLLARKEKILEQKFDERVKLRAQSLASSVNAGADNWKRLCDAIGDVAPQFFGELYSSDIINAVRVVAKSGVNQSYSGIAQLQETLGELHQKITDAMKILSIEPKEKKIRNKK